MSAPTYNNNQTFSYLPDLEIFRAFEDCGGII